MKKVILLFSNLILQFLFSKISTLLLAFSAPMIYTAPNVTVLMRAYQLRGQVGGGWALEIENLRGGGYSAGWWRWGNTFLDGRITFRMEDTVCHGGIQCGLGDKA